MSRLHDGEWHQILPYQREYKETDDVMEQSHNFNFLLTKSDYDIRIFMKAKSITTSLFQHRVLSDQEVFHNINSFSVYKFNYKLYLNDVFPITDHIKRDKFYHLLSDSRVKNTSILVVARRIKTYAPLQKKLRILSVNSMAKVDGRHKALKQKNGEPLYLVDIYVSTDNPDNVIRVKETLRSDHSMFRSRTVSKNEIIKKLNRKITSWFTMFFGITPNIMGLLLNYCGLNVVWDTVLNDTELTNIVILPQDPAHFSIMPGESATVQTGFDIEHDDE